MTRTTKPLTDKELAELTIRALKDGDDKVRRVCLEASGARGRFKRIAEAAGVAVPLVVHIDCPKPTGPKGSLMACSGGDVSSPDGRRFYCEACGCQVNVIELFAAALDGHEDVSATMKTDVAGRPL